MLLVYAALASLLVQPAPVAPSPEAGLRWLELPTLTSHDYPVAALNQGLSGEATLRCFANSDGHPVNCEVLRESPPDLGFGAAAISVVQRGRLDPASLSAAEDPASFTVRIPFVLDLGEPPPVDTRGPPTGWVTIQCSLGSDFTARGCAIDPDPAIDPGFAQEILRLSEGRPIPPEGRRGASPGDLFSVRAPYWSSDRQH